MRPEIGTIHVLVDIDDHKRAEAHLAECNAQLELAGKAARVGSLAIDLSTALVDLSPGCAMILGLPESTLQTSRDTARKLVHPEDIAQLDAARDQALRKKEREFVTQFRILRADDGEVRWLEVRSQIFYNPGGEPLRLIAVIIDFTDRKRAEDTLHQREAELVEAQRLARIGSWHWDAESDVAVGSEELLRIFGLDLGTRRLPSYREQRGRWYPVDDWKWLKAAIQSTMQTGVSYELELQALRNGTPIWITARGAVVRNSTDQIVGLRGTVQEITDRKLAELALAERNTQLELASKTARVGSFSVDLSTGVVKLTSGCTTIFGLPEGTTEISRDDGRKLVHREDLPLLAVRHDHALLAQQREVIAQFRIVRADDGEVRWIEARNLIFYDLRGKPAHLIGVSIDFTERKIAEEMLAESATCSSRWRERSGSSAATPLIPRLREYRFRRAMQRSMVFQVERPRSRTANGWLTCTRRTLGNCRCAGAKLSTSGERSTKPTIALFVATAKLAGSNRVVSFCTAAMAVR
jgi:PAS domain S-box-containing protein